MASKSSTLRSRDYPKYPSQFGQHLTYMYLLPDAEQTYLKHPISHSAPQPPQFHTPMAPIKIRKSRFSMLKTGMQRLSESFRPLKLCVFSGKYGTWYAARQIAAYGQRRANRTRPLPGGTSARARHGASNRQGRLSRPTVSICSRR